MRGAQETETSTSDPFFLSTLGLERDALTLSKRLGDPLRFGQTVGGHDEIFQRLSKNVGLRVAEHVYECFVHPEHAVIGIRNAKCIGRRLRHLLKQFQARGECVLLVDRFRGRLQALEFVGG